VERKGVTLSAVPDDNNEDQTTTNGKSREIFPYGEEKGYVPGRGTLTAWRFEKVSVWKGGVEEGRTGERRVGSKERGACSEGKEVYADRLQRGEEVGFQKGAPDSKKKS